MSKRDQFKTALLFGEGRHEYNFCNFLLGTNKFSVLQKSWSIDTEHASGCSAEDILNACIDVMSGKPFDVTLCFIDVDDLKNDFTDSFEAKRDELNVKAKENGIDIVWQEENLEEVLFVATNGKIKTKGVSKTKLKKYEDQILRSDHVKHIFHRLFSLE